MASPGKLTDIKPGSGFRLRRGISIEPRSQPLRTSTSVLPSCAGDGETRKVTETSVTLPVDAGGTTCIAVTLVRKDGTAGTETRKCTP